MFSKSRFHMLRMLQSGEGVEILPMKVMQEQMSSGLGLEPD